MQYSPAPVRRKVPDVTANLPALLTNGLRLARRELPLLMIILVIAGGMWVFVAISEEVVEGDTHAVDEAVMLALRSPADRADPLGPSWVEELARDATAFGSVGVVTFITLATAIFLSLQGKGRAAVFVVIAVASGTALSFALKSGFDRPRPDLVSHATAVFTTSFPSAHAMMSAVAYLTLGTLLARMQERRRLKIYVIVLAILMTVAVGVSRVYLGVHWPTDVLAGWAAGASWAMLCWTVALWLQRSRRVEPTLGDPAPANVTTPPR